MNELGVQGLSECADKRESGPAPISSFQFSMVPFIECQELHRLTSNFKYLAGLCVNFYRFYQQDSSAV